MNLVASAVPSGIALNWSAVTASTYNVYRGSYPGGESSIPLAMNVSGTSYVDPTSDLTSGVDYSYWVTAVASANESAPSNEATAFANGPYLAPSMDFTGGFPSASASQFSAVNSSFNTDATVSIGGSLQYNTAVNTKQFNQRFTFVQSLASVEQVLTLSLVSPGGKSVVVYSPATLQANFNLPIVPGDTEALSLTYNQGRLDIDAQDYPPGNSGMSVQTFSTSASINLPMALSSATAFPVLSVSAAGQSATLKTWFFANSLLLPPATPVVSTVGNGGAGSAIELSFPTTVPGSDSPLGPGVGSSYHIYRGTSPGAEGLVPIGTTTSSTYVDSTALPGVKYYYVADSYDPNGNSALGTADNSAATAEVSTSGPIGNQLLGTPIGTLGSWDGTSAIQKVFDGKLNTFFDPANGNLTNWAGLDLGKNATITQISFAPRTGYEFRMLGGQFQASSTPDFSSNVQTLYTIGSIPAAGQLTTVNVNPGMGYRYIRYTGGTQWVNIAEMQVFGSEVPPPPSREYFTGTPIGAGGAWNSSRTYSAAFDGNLNSFFDPADGNLSDWVGLDLGTPRAVSAIYFAPRPGYEFRMVGGQFQVSSTPDFSADVHTSYTVTEAPVAGQLTGISFPAAGSYRYIRYTGGNQWVNIAEMQVAGFVPPVPLQGTAIGAGGAWAPGTGYAAAFDGSLSTYFDPANGNLTNWVGLDLGSAQIVTEVNFAPRAGYEFRMVGGMFQASNSADFSSGVVTLYTVTTAPVAGQVTTVAVNPSDTAYRYYRYTGGTQWVNIAEMELDGGV